MTRSQLLFQQTLIKEIEGLGYTLQDVREYVEKTRGISYTYDGIWKILRKEFKVNYGKPYILNANQSKTAAQELKKIRLSFR